MARLRYNGLAGTLGAPLAAADTTITLAAALTSSAGAVPTIGGGDTISLSILNASGGVAEIVSLTAYTTGATTGTISRAQEGTTAADHASGVTVVHSPTAADFSGAGKGVKGFAKTVITSGDLSLTATAVTAVGATASATDLVLSAVAGDVIEYGVAGRLDAAAQYVGFDVYTRVAGANVNPFGAGLSAGLATSGGAIPWFVPNVGQVWIISGMSTRVLVSGDIESGTVTLRLHYAKITTTARTLLAQTNYPFTVWAKNLGQP